jgi:Helix-turn-helix.
MKNNEAIKKKIYDMRRKNGLSQEGMAFLLNISLNSYRKIEKGETVLISKWLWKISEIFKVNIDELILEEDPSTRKSLSDSEREAYTIEIENLKNKIIFYNNTLNC